jgi:hypothetical protein
MIIKSEKDNINTLWIIKHIHKPDIKREDFIGKR